MHARDKPREGTPRSGRDFGCWRRFTAPAALLLLSEAPSHGYELWTRLEDVLPRSGLPRGSAGFYRMLRSLEDEGAVVSSWNISHAGPTRRVYKITRAGRRQLDGWAVSIERDRNAMSDFLDVYRSTKTKPTKKRDTEGANSTRSPPD
ncbi:MAG: PadR family transcriptional regulator [Solirubrobacteraceae bacterium]